MNAAFELFLLVSGAVGFAGTGAGLAVSRARRQREGHADAGMLAVAALLFVFGALCTLIGSGMIGLFAFGSVVCWSSYVIVAQRMGLFEVETGSLAGRIVDKPKQRT